VALHKIITGKTKNTGYLPQLADALGVSVENLLSGQWSTNLKVAENVTPYASQRRKIPLISYVMAGNWGEAVDPYELNDAFEWLDVPLEHSDQAFCLEVSGQSMEPEYLEGGRILVEPMIEARHGDDVVVRTPDGKVTFKRLQSTSEGKHLVALNKDFPSRIVEMPEDTMICGVVTGYWVDKRRHK
jgi:SOS-response transcriptional repressor LexA